MKEGHKGCGLNRDDDFGNDDDNDFANDYK